MSTNLNTSNLREKILAAFSVVELKEIIFDHFHYLYPDVEAVTSARDIVQKLLVYCELHGSESELLLILKQKRPNAFSEINSITSVTLRNASTVVAQSSELAKIVYIILSMSATVLFVVLASTPDLAVRITYCLFAGIFVALTFYLFLKE